MSTLKRWLPLMLIIGLATWPARAFAHGGGGHEASAAAGPLSWGFIGFGIAVIGLISVILFTGQTHHRRTTAADFESLTGFSGYIAKIKLFSHNARLYMLHVVGMDVIYGTWQVMFNLYLLAIGFDVAFVGTRILLASIASALFSIPAGMISDRIGRKLSFILGDGLGAVMSLIAISTTDPTLLLITGFIGGAFGALHGVAEPAFMAENSENFERVHLFSVSDGTRTAAAIIGSALAGLMPLLFAGTGGDEAAKVGLYRTVAYIGIGGWFASLIPALLLKQTAAPTVAPSKRLFTIKHPDRIWKLTLPELFIGLGAGLALPMLNVFFAQRLGSPDVEIGATFAAGQSVLVIGAFLAPLLAARLGKINAVVVTRLASIPFVLLMAFAPNMSSEIGTAVLLAGFAYVSRVVLMNMASPVRSAFGMEILAPEERGTQTGLQQALVAALSGGASYIGAQWMSGGDFQTPFYLMAVCYLIGTLLFWRFFGGREHALSLAAAPAAAAAGD